MSNIIILPIREDFLERARLQDRDDQGQPVRHLQAAGGEPCRDVLRRARVGEPLILASYEPFDRPGPYHEYGPIFIRAEAQPETVERHVLPFGSTAEDAYLASPFALRAYSHKQDIVDARLATIEDGEEIISMFLGRPDIAFVDLRFAAYGCFACRIVTG